MVILIVAKYPYCANLIITGKFTLASGNSSSLGPLNLIPASRLVTPSPFNFVRFVPVFAVNAENGTFVV